MRVAWAAKEVWFALCSLAPLRGWRLSAFGSEVMSEAANAVDRNPFWDILIPRMGVCVFRAAADHW